MTFIIKLRVSRIPMLLKNFFIKSWRHCSCRRITIINSIIYFWIHWLRMMNIWVLLNHHLRLSSFFRSIFVVIFIILHSSIFIKYILWRCFVHHHSVCIIISHFVFISLQMIFLFFLSMIFFGIWWSTVFFIIIWVPEIWFNVIFLQLRYTLI